MNDMKLNTYRTLNTLAEQDGIVIFGGTQDQNIPLCELKQAFALEPQMYNRSIDGLSVDNAIKFYDEYVSDLRPETLLLHIGDEDLNAFEHDPAAFDQKYRSFISHVKNLCKKCRIAIISLRNPGNSPCIAEMNKHLKYLAEAEQCEYGDIALRRLWNPKETRDVVSFVYSTGFVRPMKHKRPIYDLIKILFCYE